MTDETRFVLSSRDAVERVLAAAERVDGPRFVVCAPDAERRLWADACGGLPVERRAGEWWLGSLRVVVDARLEPGTVVVTCVDPRGE